MPELAEVEFFRRQWDPGIGRTVEVVDVHPEARVFRGCAVDRLVAEVSGAVLTRSHAHGKHLLFEFAGESWIGVHLGMTGELKVVNGWPAASRHDHLVLRQPGQSLVFADSRMFGRIRFERSPGQPPAWWRSLPPAILSPEFTPAWLTERWRRRARAPLKAMLLDQEIFPGLGNWMADEILWRLRLHPRLPAGDLMAMKSLNRLHKEVQWLARRSLATIGVDWRDPPASWLYRHRWAAGTRCPRPLSRAPLRRELAAGRTTCWCPACQPGPPGDEGGGGRAVRTGRRRESPTS